jgi:hypothetical protein
VKATGDRYGGLWPAEQLAKFGISYEPSPLTKSELYGALLPLLNSRRIELLDHPKLVSQLCSLERRTARGGRDSIDHPPSSHDDLANVIAGCAAVALGAGRYNIDALADLDDDDPYGIEHYREARLRNYLASGGMIR